MSVRYLHRLFEGEETTVCRLIQRRRLEECSRELARRGRATPTVAAVAHRWGFTSPAHFSRVFRAAYGVPLASGAHCTPPSARASRRRPR